MDTAEDLLLNLRAIKAAQLTWQEELLLEYKIVELKEKELGRCLTMTEKCELLGKSERSVNTNELLLEAAIEDPTIFQQERALAANYVRIMWNVMPSKWKIFSNEDRPMLEKCVIYTNIREALNNLQQKFHVIEVKNNDHILHRIITFLQPNSWLLLWSEPEDIGYYYKLLEPKGIFPLFPIIVAKYKEQKSTKQNRFRRNYNILIPFSYGAPKLAATNHAPIFYGTTKVDDRSFIAMRELLSCFIHPLDLYLSIGCAGGSSILAAMSSEAIALGLEEEGCQWQFSNVLDFYYKGNKSGKLRRNSRTDKQ